MRFYCRKLLVAMSGLEWGVGGTLNARVTETVCNSDSGGKRV